jgi:hypothetical protein
MAKVTDRLAARYPETPRNVIAAVVAEEYALSGRRPDPHLHPNAG